ncbi:MAG: LytTR family DNA-binding domain-containing protein [Bacteroidota bacterium]
MNTIIIDDEKDGRSILKTLMQKNHPVVNVVAEAVNGIEGEQLIKKYQPDFIFLDVDMPLCDGFEMLSKFDNINFEIVFTTAYNAYALKAFKYSPFDFLLKPINLEELSSTINRLEERIKNKPAREHLKDFLQLLKVNQHGIKKIAITTSEGFEILDTNDIVLLEADGSYTKFYLKNNLTMLTSSGIGEYEDMLAASTFMRIHKSFIININEIKKFLKADGGSVIMSNGKEAFISKRKKEEFLAFFTKR